MWGGSGFIGSHLVERLRSLHEVHVLTRNPAVAAQLESRGIRALAGVPSAYPAAELTRLLEPFDVIYDLAGSSGAVTSNDNPLESVQSQCIEHLHLLQCAAATGRTPHFVFASSRLVYGAPAILPVPETHPVAPASFYAVHKYAVEQYYRIFGGKRTVTFTLCRISNPYGFDHSATGKSYGFVNALLERGVRGEPLTVFGDGSQLRDYVHIADLSKALHLCGFESSAKNAVFNIGSGIGVSIRDAAETIARLTGTQVIFAPWPRDYSAVESGDYVSDLSNIRRALDFAPEYAFEDGLRTVASQYQKHYSELRQARAPETQRTTTEAAFTTPPDLVTRRANACS